MVQGRPSSTYRQSITQEQRRSSRRQNPVTASSAVQQHHIGHIRAPPSPSSSTTNTSPWTPLEYDDDNDSLSQPSVATNTSTWQEEAHWMSFRQAVSQFASLQMTKRVVEEEEEDSSASGESSSEQQRQQQQRPSALLEADLAETRMRLALAQAERDEMEFVLLQHHQESARSLQHR